MSNLAYQQEKQQRPVISPEKKVIVKKRASITLGEKVLLVLFAIAVLSTSMFIVSKAYAAYQSNIEVQKLEEKVSEKNKQIGDLQKTAGDLSQPQRLMDIAKKHGLNLKDKKVKNIQE
ncbi:cell division protein FtsL [Bacillus siamensis]|uniref:cell division protein FtsL n=1 Tax=Bacillus TaxID=1386 RepID=UPI00031D51C2|nr:MULTISPECIES: cell division protein FtsL [Bacillus]MBD0406165.1 cell division protein FtsL [Bacillus sp. 1021]MEC3653702.1 cell division protein FtsL [Bacillus siamensis]MED0772953.1 cell division protein FtsL [Bacillus siamensis]MED0775467.1 cell division protein FtsL [Bacillus siamensis]MED0778707.1 cell division protein FtsL [Bacillus siamensis]